MDDLKLLSDADRDLLVEMFCCVIAADKKLSEREVSVVINTLATLGQPTAGDSLKTQVVDYCKAIHKKGVDAYLADVIQRAKRLAGLPLAASFIEAQPTLLSADGASTPDEERVSQQLVQCLSEVFAKADADLMPDVLLDEPTVTAGTSMIGTARTSAALAAAAAERTRLTTVTLPAAYIALGKHCLASNAFASDFPTLYALIAKLSEEMKTTADKLTASSTASTFAGKAQELASKGMTLAISQKHNVQYQRLMHDLGKAVYEAKGTSSGPKELCDPIVKYKQRVEQLASSVTASSKDLKEAASGVGRSAAQAATAASRGGFLQSPFVIAITSIAFAPLGLLLLWRHPTWSRGFKASWTTALLVLVMVVGLRSKGMGGNENDIRLGMSPSEVIAIMGKPDHEERSFDPVHADAILFQRWNRGDGPTGFDGSKSLFVMYASNGVPQNKVTQVSGNGKIILNE